MSTSIDIALPQPVTISLWVDKNSSEPTKEIGPDRHYGSLKQAKSLVRNAMYKLGMDRICRIETRVVSRDFDPGTVFVIRRVNASRFTDSVDENDLTSRTERIIEDAFGHAASAYYEHVVKKTNE